MKSSKLILALAAIVTVAGISAVALAQDAAKVVDGQLLLFREEIKDAPRPVWLRPIVREKIRIIAADNALVSSDDYPGGRIVKVR